MKKLKSVFTKRWAGYTLTACIAVLLYETLEHFEVVRPLFEGLKGFFSPIIIGIAIAYLFDPVADDFLREGCSKTSKASPQGTPGE